MAETAMGLPGVREVGHKFLNPGVPVIAGFVGFVSGDIFGAYGLVAEFMGGVEQQLPFTSKIDYTAAATLVPYGIVLGVVEILGAVVFPTKGVWSGAIFRAARFFLIGIMIHVALAAVLPNRIPVGAPLSLPSQVR